MVVSRLNIRFKSEFSFFLCVIFLMLRPFTKLFVKTPIWLISEKEDEARDNGFEFFNYIQTKETGRDVYYVIKKNSYDFHKVEHCKHVFFGSLKHYLLFSVSECLISSQMHTAIPYPFVNRTKYFKRLCHELRIIFLQHGVTKDNFELFTRERTQIDLFICAGKQEYNYLFANAGYGCGKNRVVLTGFPRFDQYYTNAHNGVSSILIFPTFRKWLVSSKKNPSSSGGSSFEKSQFYRFYKELLEDQRLIEFLETNNIELIFCLHYAMQSLSSSFKSCSGQIKIVSSSNADIRNLIVSTDLLITDRSSLAFDYAYMMKPVAYLDFDSKEFEKCHYKPGYFDYLEHGFGPVFNNPKLLINFLEKRSSDCGKMEELYETRAKDFFAFYDTNNSERVYHEIIKYLEECD